MPASPAAPRPPTPATISMPPHPPPSASIVPLAATTTTTNVAGEYESFPERKKRDPDYGEMQQQQKRPEAQEEEKDRGMPQAYPSSKRMPREEVMAPSEIPVFEGLRRLVEGGKAVEDAGDGDGSEDFEFSFVSGGRPEAVTADEIFSNGQIRPIYPLLFDRALVLDGCEYRHRGGAATVEARDRPSVTRSSESDELEGVPARTYRAWAPPSPDLGQKSRSTGAASKRWRLCNLVVGRSRSDGEEKLGYLAAPPPPPPEAVEKAGEGKKGRGDGRVSEMDMVTAHRLYYATAGGRRQSFLPYRRDLVGFFGRAGVGHQPF